MDEEEEKGESYQKWLSANGIVQFEAYYSFINEREKCAVIFGEERNGGGIRSNYR